MRKLELTLFLVLLTTYSFFVQYPNVNQNTRFDLTRAIVEDHTITIDRYHENTVDKSYFGGHWYTDKAPGLSFLAVPVYAVLLAMQPVADSRVWLGYPIHVLNAATVALPTALLALLLWRWVRRASGSDTGALAAATLFGLGTLALPFAALFFGHMTSAFFGFAAFYALWLLRHAQPAGQREPAMMLVAGLLAGPAALIEYPTAALAVLLGVYAFTLATNRRNVVYYVLGLLPWLLLFMIYNNAAFGSPLALSYRFSPVVQGQDLTQMRLPTLAGLWSITLGGRGIFLLSPVLLLAAPGLLALWRRSDLRREFWVFLLSVLGFGLIAVLYYDQLGSVPGPRYLITGLPFAAAVVGLLWPRWRVVVIALGSVSIAVMLLVTATNPAAPLTIAQPLTNYWLPALAQRSIVPTTLFLRFGLRSALGLLVLAGVLAVGVAAWAAHLRQAGAARERVLTLCAIVALVAYLILGFPIDLLHPLTVPPVIVGFVP
jgi:hypothetical protein